MRCVYETEFTFNVCTVSYRCFGKRNAVFPRIYYCGGWCVKSAYSLVGNIRLHFSEFVSVNNFQTLNAVFVSAAVKFLNFFFIGLGKRNNK